MHKLEGLCFEIESWEPDPDDESVQILYYKLIEAKSIYLEYFYHGEEEEEGIEDEKQKTSGISIVKGESAD